MHSKLDISRTPSHELGKPRHLFFKQEELAVVKKICELTGVPVNPGVKVSREDLDLDDDFKIHLDIGGEGLNEHVGFISGFPNSINLNAISKQSNDYGIPIPNLVKLKSWLGAVSYPFSDGFADYITMQNAPLTDENVREIARCLRPGGTVELWIDDCFIDNMNKLAQLLHSKVEYDIVDEFDGSTGSKKFRIVSGLKPVLEDTKGVLDTQKSSFGTALSYYSIFPNLDQKRITYPGYEHATDSKVSM